MSYRLHLLYRTVARNDGGIPLSVVCPFCSLGTLPPSGEMRLPVICGRCTYPGTAELFACLRCCLVLYSSRQTLRNCFISTSSLIIPSEFSGIAYINFHTWRKDAKRQFLNNQCNILQRRVQIVNFSKNIFLFCKGVQYDPFFSRAVKTHFLYHIPHATNTNPS